MPANYTYIVDDQDSGIDYLCPITKEKVLQSFFNNTWTTIASSSCGAGWFSYKFNGTAVTLAATSSKINTNFSVQIDDSPLLIQNGQGYYQSPILAEKEHTVLYAMSDMSLSPSFDYLTVTTSSYPSGRTLIVDDQDGSVQYSGNWTTKAPTDLVFGSSSPYLNSTHWSNNVGDSLTFQFTGSSISVYGVLLNATAGGNVTASYSIDGKASSLSLPPGTNQPLAMSQLFHSDLHSGDHTLLINVTSITGPQALGIDFMLYNSTVPTTSKSSSNGRNIGLIVGSVVGGVVALVLIALLFLLFMRRRRRNRVNQAALAATVVTLNSNAAWSGDEDSEYDTASMKDEKLV